MRNKKHKKQKISIAIGALVFVILMFGNILVWQDKPDELQLPIDRTVENTAISKNINVSEKSEAVYLANLFPDCSITTTGGAMPSMIIIRFYSASASDFLSKIEQGNIREIYYSFESKDTVVTKKYWASPQREICDLKPVTIFKMKEQRYELSFAQEDYYSIKRYNATAVTFVKSFLFLNGFLHQVIIATLVALIALLAYAITLVILFGLEKVVKFALKQVGCE